MHPEIPHGHCSRPSHPYWEANSYLQGNVLHREVKVELTAKKTYNR